MEGQGGGRGKYGAMVMVINREIGGRRWTKIARRQNYYIGRTHNEIFL